MQRLGVGDVAVGSSRLCRAEGSVVSDRDGDKMSTKFPEAQP